MKQASKCILIGAQKAGTTSIYDWLSQHDDIHAPPEAKDFHFFTNEEYYKKGYTYYESFLKGWNQEKVVLSGGVNFIYHPIAIERIINYNSEVKLIAILRNPVDRAYSAWNYFVKTGVENLTFEKAIEEEKNRNTTYLEKSNFTYMDHGFYGNQIEHILNHIPKEQLFVGIFEEIIKDKEKFINDVCTFLNIHPFKPEFTKVNKGGLPKSKALSQVLFGQSKLRMQLMKVFGTIVPVSVRTKMKNSLMELNTSNKKSDPLSVERKKELIKLFESDIHKLETLLGINLDIWKN